MKKKTKAENTESVETVAPKAADYVRKRTEIEVAKLKLAPWNPRSEITPESVADLAASIKSLGMIQPVVAMIDADGGATLIAGHRRLAAALPPRRSPGLKPCRATSSSALTSRPRSA